MSYKYEVQVGSDPKWYSNSVVFETMMEADDAGASKYEAWTICAAYRVVESDEKPNYRWVNHQLKGIE